MKARTLERIKRVLLLNDKYSLLPEIADFFGDSEDGVEWMIDFLKVFGGSTIKVPKIEVIDRVETDVEIFEQLHRSPNDMTVEDLSSIFGVAPVTVKAIYRRVATALSIEPSPILLAGGETDAESVEDLPGEDVSIEERSDDGDDEEASAL